MFRFIHTADLHLDAPLRSLALRDAELFERVGSASRAALACLVDACLEHRVQALLIAGDLYDRDLRSMKTAAFLGAQMERLHRVKIPVFIIRGNHDAESLISRELVLPPNVHLFSGHGGTVRLTDHDVAIHGVSFAKPQASESLLPKYPAPVAGCFNIGLMHTSVGGAEGHDTYAPCSVQDLQHHGYDYWALGHIHKRQVHGENPHVVMPGMPQGRDIGEAGPKSATLVQVDGGAVTLTEIPTAEVVFERLQVPVDGVAGWRVMLARIADALRAAGQEGETIFRLELSGQTPLAWQVRRDMDLLAEQIKEVAQGMNGVWIEKISSHLQQLQASVPRDDPRFEMQEIMQELLQDAPTQARAGELATWLVGELPPEIRADFGADKEAFAAEVTAILAEGLEEIVARMMDDKQESET